MPRGAGGMPTRSNWPSILLSDAIGRSPWNTRMVTADWLSANLGRPNALHGANEELLVQGLEILDRAVTDVFETRG